jgi:hypothetical protein
MADRKLPNAVNASADLAFSRVETYCGNAIAAKMPIIITTIKTSKSVKPLLLNIITSAISMQG